MQLINSDKEYPEKESKFLGWPIVLYVLTLVCEHFDQSIASPTVVAVGAFFLFFAYRKIQWGYFQFIAPFVGVFICGLTGFAGYGEYEQRDILRDLSFSLTPIMAITIGFCMASEKSHEVILKSIMVCSFYLAVVHLINFYLNVEWQNISSIVDIRRSAGSSTVFVYFALVLSCFIFGLRAPRVFPQLLPFYVMFPVLLISCILSFSRTGWVVAVASLLSLVGVFSKIRFKSVAYIFIFAASFSAIILTSKEEDQTSFRGKMAHSVKEMAISNYEDKTDINTNWRGFEAHKGFEAFMAGSISQQIFGHGFGAVADLGFEMPLGNIVLRYIPIFHNGYVYVLLKTGWIGLALYLFFYISLLRKTATLCNYWHGNERFLSRMLLAISLTLILDMLVVGGIAQAKNSLLLVIVGYLYRLLRQKKQSIILEQRKGLHE